MQTLAEQVVMTGLGSKRAAWDPEGSIPDVRRVDISLHPEPSWIG